jgi:hypothetical protein
MHPADTLLQLLLRRRQCLVSPGALHQLPGSFQAPAAVVAAAHGSIQ